MNDKEENFLRRKAESLASRKGIGTVIFYSSVGLAIVSGFVSWWLFDTWEKAFEHLLPHWHAVILEFVLVFALVEGVWRFHERAEQQSERERSLLLIKSYMFQAHMRRLFEVNFAALHSKEVTIQKLIEKKFPVSKDDQAKFLESIDYPNRKLKGKAIQEYLRTEAVWDKFLQLGIQFGLDRVVSDMTDILRSLDGLKRAVSPEQALEMDPEKLVDKLTDQQNSVLRIELDHILKNGILKFWEYADQLSKRTDQQLFISLKRCYGIEDNKPV